MPTHTGEKSQQAKILPFISGGIAGGVEAVITYPFEFAKTRVQLQRAGESAANSTKNPLRIITNVVRTEGVRSLYKGCPALVLGSIAKDGTRFLTFDTIKSAFSDPDTGTLTPARSLLAGMTSGLVSSTVASTPTERLKTAIIDDARSSKRFHGMRDAFRVILKNQGFFGLYRGFAGTTLRQSGSTALRMGTYNILKDYETRHEVAQGVGENFLNGAVAGLITTLGTQPFDVIKTRSQSAAGATFTGAIRSVWADAGVKGFWTGTTMRLSRTVLSAGILFTTYERITVVLGSLLG